MKIGRGDRKPVKFGRHRSRNEIIRGGGSDSIIEEETAVTLTRTDVAYLHSPVNLA